MADTSEEKELPASAKKLREARQKGQTAKSPELVSSWVTLAGFSYVMAQVAPSAARFSDIIVAAGDATTKPWNKAVRPLVTEIALTGGLIALPLYMLVLIVVVIANIVSTGGLAMSLQPLMPNLQSLNPISGVKKLFSLKKLIELLKNLIKMIAVASIAYQLLKHAIQPLVEQPTCGLACAPQLFHGLLLPLVELGAVFFFVAGFFDLAIQKWLFLRDQRMTKTEMKREHKNSEGDPHIKGARKRTAREAADTKVGVKQATFVIMGNKLVVAMRYNAKDTRVPTVTAKADGERAAELLSQARKLGLPSHYNHDLTVLVATETKLGQPIKQALFQPVIDIMRLLGQL